MPVSLADIAARVGVSAGTVSSALSGRAAARIAPKTQERIRLAAIELGYQPNRFARSMRTGRTGTIGLMVARLTNPFFASLVASIEDDALTAGWDVLIDADFEFRASNQFTGKLCGWRVDGVLMWALPELEASTFIGEQANDIPIIYLGYPRGSHVDVVMTDLYGGSRLAMEHLIARGRRRIAYVSATDELASARRDAKFCAYEDGCREAGIQPRLITMQSQAALYSTTQKGLRMTSYETGMEIAKESDTTRPDAVLCAADVIAIGVYHGFVRAGRSVPDDMAIVGFDGIEEGQCLVRPLTSVVTPVDRISKEAVAMLYRKQSTEGREPEQMVIPATLRLGETS